MRNAVTRFLGDTPLRVAIKLALISLMTGIIMSTFGLSPRSIYEGIINLFQNLWDMGWEAVSGSLEYLLLGAAVVVPVFLLIRLLNFRSPKS